MTIRNKAIESVANTNRQSIEPDETTGVELMKKPEIRERAIQEIPTLATELNFPIDTDQRQVVGNNLANTEKMENLKKQDPNTMSMTDKFSLAVAAFAPTILGAIFGGTEDAAAAAQGTLTGAQAGLNLAKGFQDMEIAGIEAQQIPVLTEIKQKEANAEALRASTGSVKEDRLSKEAPTRLKIAEDRLKVSRESLEQRISSQEQQDTQFKQREARQVLAGSELSGTQVDKMSDLMSARTTIDKLIPLHKLSDTGPIKGRLKSLAIDFGLNENADFTAIRATAASALSSYMNAISGKAVTEAEAKRLATVIPSVTDSEETFMAKLKTFRSQLDSSMGNFVKTVGAGQVRKKEAAEKVWDIYTKESAPVGSKNKENPFLNMTQEERNKKRAEVMAKVKGKN